ncbi:MAG TPA: hypothetical protein PLA50_01545 [Bacteroidia bacterium]|nr:hypothetical protein [Bacteroidia bacterium]
MKSVPSSHRRLCSGAGILPVLVAIAATLLCLPQSHAQTEVPTGSALRKSLFELARPSVESEAGQKVLFEGSLKQLGEWAFFMGRIVSAKGAEIVPSGYSNGSVGILWVQRSGRWGLVTTEVGPTDLFYSEWPATYGVPRNLLGL